MSEQRNTKFINQDDMIRVLDVLYDKSKSGIGKVSPPISKMADDYLKRDSDPQVACKKMRKAQIAKCTTSGVLTGFGGLITLPGCGSTGEPAAALPETLKLLPEPRWHTAQESGPLTATSA